MICPPGFAVAVILATLISTAFSQSKKSDSLVSEALRNSEGDTLKVGTLISLAEALTSESNLTDALYQAGVAKNLAERIHFHKGLALANLQIGIILYKTGQYQQALQPLTESLRYFRDRNDGSNQAMALHWLGNVNYATSNYHDALENYLQSYALREALKDLRGMAFSLNNISNIYSDQGDFQKALEYQFRSLTLKKDIGDEISIATSYNNIAYLYAKRKKYADAMQYYKNALDIFQRMNDRRGIAFTLGNMGELYEQQGFYSHALSKLKQAAVLLEQDSDNKAVAEAYNHIGWIMMVLQKYDESKKYLDKAQTNALQANASRELLENYGNMARLDSAKGDMESAYTWMKKYRDLYTQVFNAEKSRQIAQLQTAFETERKDRAIQLLEKEKEFQEKQRATQQMFYIAAVATMIVVSVGLVYFLRQKHKANAILETRKIQLQELNQLKDKLFSIVAHDLRSPLQNLKGVLSLAGKNQVTETELKSLLGTIGQNTQYTIELVDNLLTWSRDNLHGSSMHPEILNLRDIILTNVRLLAPQAAGKNITITESLQDEVFAEGDKSMIELIFRNLISNAIKFTHQGGSVDISSSTSDRYVTISIRDNGIGICAEAIHKLFGTENFSTRGTANEKGTGLGLVLCKEFVEKNNGTIRVESERGKGSNFLIQLPHGKLPQVHSTAASIQLQN